MKIAVLGLGRMGSAIAGRLLDRGHAVTVWNRSPGKDAALLAQGARPAASAAGAAAGADAVITMLSDDGAVRAVCLEDGGVVAALDPDAVLVDMSTVSPDTSHALAAAVPGRRFVEAPELAGPHAVRQGQGLLLLGGDEALVNRLQPLWADLIDRRLYCGPTGSGTSMKLLSNFLLMGSVALLSEAVALGQAAGFGDDFLRQVLREHPLVPAGVHNRLDDVIAGDHSGWFTVTLARKDVRLAVELAARSGLRTENGNDAARLLAATEAAGLGDKDLGAMIEAVRPSPAS
jgi:3-hydroxyisobutyrate dehydrogenase-like beta-hydroxyacid dehydrogenase